jgi:hypothetical protein
LTFGQKRHLHFFVFLSKQGLTVFCNRKPVQQFSSRLRRTWPNSVVATALSKLCHLKAPHVEQLLQLAHHPPARRLLPVVRVLRCMLQLCVNIGVLAPAAAAAAATTADRESGHVRLQRGNVLDDLHMRALQVCNKEGSRSKRCYESKC